MSTLTNCLNRIMNWLQQNQPEFAASFLPGLNDEQIQDIVKDLPYQLPEEIHELYRWRNGIRNGTKLYILFHPFSEFLSLKEALEVAQESIDIFEDTEDELRFEGNRLFPFIDDNGDLFVVRCTTEKQDNSPVISVQAEYYEPNIVYTNLTTMMQTVAECYETGAYYINDEGFIEEDENKVAEILRKYNSEILERDDY